MKIRIVFCLFVCLFMLGMDLINLSAGDFTWERIDGVGDGINSVFLEPGRPEIIYVASKNCIYKSVDGGVSWKNILTVGASSSIINIIGSDRDSIKNIFCLSSDGAYISYNSGMKWMRLFRGKTSDERSCRAMLITGPLMLLGTDAGLFMSKDKGRSWQKCAGEVGTARISAIGHNKARSECIYISSDRGVYCSFDGGDNWERTFVSIVRSEPEDKVEASGEDVDGFVNSIVQYITVDPDDADVIYIATRNGVYRSSDKAKNWIAMTDYGLLSSDVRSLVLDGRSGIIAVTKNGVFRFDNNRWEELSLRLITKNINLLAVDSAGHMLVACDNGLFRSEELKFKARNEQYLSVAIESEPDISKVQNAAIAYADVNLDKIKDWRARAAKKAWLPKFTTGVNSDSGDLWHWETGSSTKNEDDTLRRGKSSLEWDVCLSWDFSELVWNRLQNIPIEMRDIHMVLCRGQNIVI